MGEIGWVKIEDYYHHNMCRRYGGIVPQHARMESILAAQSREYEKRIKEFTSFMDQFLTIPLSSSFAISPKEPVWNNDFFPAFDAISLFGLISTLKPHIYFEIGSGHSTRIAAKAKALNSPSTRIISIDPFPRTEIDELCDEVIRKPLEECDLSLFDQLSDNDILFFDGSHRVLQNSDTEVFFFDILPRLKRMSIFIYMISSGRLIIRMSGLIACIRSSTFWAGYCFTLRRILRLFCPMSISPIVQNSLTIFASFGMNPAYKG